MHSTSYILLCLVVSGAKLRGGCDPRLESCSEPWNTPAQNPSTNQLKLSLGAPSGSLGETLGNSRRGSGLGGGISDGDTLAGSNGGILTSSTTPFELNMPAFDIPTFDQVEIPEPDEMPVFNTVPAQTAPTPTLSSSVADSLPTPRTTTTPPPFYTAKIDFNNIPTFTTKNMKLFDPLPPMEAVNKLAYGGPFFRAISKFIG